MAGAHGNRTHLPACDRYHGFEARGAHQVPFRSPDPLAIPVREKLRRRIFEGPPKIVKRNHPATGEIAASAMAEYTFHIRLRRRSGAEAVEGGCHAEAND